MDDDNLDTCWVFVICMLLILMVVDIYYDWKEKK